LQRFRVDSKPASVVVGKVGVGHPGNTGVGHVSLTAGGVDGFRAVIPFYIPVVFFWMTAIWAIIEGGDDEIGWGTLVGLVGFIVSIAILRLEFFKGFCLNIGFSMLIGIGLCSIFTFSSDIFEDLFFDFHMYWCMILLPAILPVRLHLYKAHVRALGSAYAMPVCMFIILMGVAIGIFGW